MGGGRGGGGAGRGGAGVAGRQGAVGGGPRGGRGGFQRQGAQPTASQKASWASLGVCFTSATRGPPSTSVLGASGVNGGQYGVFAVCGREVRANAATAS